MLWIWLCPVITNELLLKISVPKRQIKSLKTTREVVSFYYIYKLYNLNLPQTILSEAFLKDTFRVKVPSNKIPALTKSTNMDNWVVGRSNHFFIIS